MYVGVIVWTEHQKKPHFVTHVNFTIMQTHLRLEMQHYDLCPVDSCVNLLSALDSRNGVMSMRTSDLRALLHVDNSSRNHALQQCLMHQQWFMPIICYFRKLQAPRSALVCGATWHARVRWLCWQIFRTFQTWNRLWREERVAKFIQNVTNIFIFHLTQSFRPAT